MKKNRLILLAATMLLLAVLCGCSCEHEFGEWQTKDPSTCTVAGTEERACTKCGDKETREAALVSHDFGEWGVVTEPACNAVGEESRVCSSCGAAENREIPMLTEHSYGEWSTVKEPTCTEKGSREQTCPVCGKVNTEEMGAAGHSYDSKGICTACHTENPKLTELKERVTIYGTFITVNSADGVNLYITWENESTKEIKYITFAVQLYNKVNDPIVCQIRKNPLEYVQQVGPVPQGKGMYTSARTDAYGYAAIFKDERVSFDQFKEDKANGWAEQRWDTVWYNSSAHYAKVVGVEIEYMDGSMYSCQEQSVLDCIGALYLNRNQDKNQY